MIHQNRNMFGEYAQIATYLPSSRDSSGAGDFPAGSLPPHLLPPPSVSLPLWAGAKVSRRGRGQEVMEDRSSSLEDFIMVAEFSEIEGPKPVLTIPKDAGSSIDQNALSVKLMAVDHQTSSEGFSISEDTQVVLSDDDSGVSAFVHHFVLYDNQARGFVRPYCMVFISTDIRKIMMFYEELSSQFKRAARFLKYGNRLLFVKDLEHHLEDLEHTKGYLLNQVGRMRLKESQGPESEQSKARANAENELYKGLQNIQQSTTEIRDILTVLKPILHDRRLENRFRVLEDRAFHRGNEELALAEKLSLQEDWFADNLYSESPTNGPVSGSLKESSVSPVSLFTASPSHTPLLVETKKAKRFNSPLRGLHELCSWGAKEGLRKLRCIHEYFRKDAMVLEIERNESRLMDPSNSMVIHGHCVTSNVLAGVTMRGSSLGLSEDSSSMLLSAGKLNRWSSFGSDDTLESFKSLDSYMSIRDEEETASLYSLASNNSSPGVTTSTSGQDFVSAPTSPMADEVAFPPTPPQTTPPTDAAPSGASSQPTDATAHVPQSQTTQSSSDIPPELSALPPGTTSMRSPPAVVSPQAQAVNNMHSPAAVVSPQAQAVNNMHSPAAGLGCQLDRDDALQDRSGTIKPSNDDAIQDTGGTIKPSNDDAIQDTGGTIKPSNDDAIQDTGGTIKPSNDDAIQDTGGTIKPSNDDAIQDTGGTIKPNSDAASELDADAASAVLGAAAAPDRILEQRGDSLSEHLHNQNLSDELEAVQGGKTDDTSSTSAAAETCNSAVGSKGSGASRTAGMFPSQTAEAGAVLNRLKEKDASALNSCADFSPMLNGGIAVQNPSKMAVARVPSFLPLMTLNPAQQIRATQRQHSNHSNLSSSPEKSVDGLPGNMDRWKMESTESFRSMTDTLSQTDDGYCDMDSAADSVFNMFTATTPSSGTCLWKPRDGIFTLGDVLNSLGPGRPGHGIHEVMSTYSNLHPVLFSLMTGRTVLVVGPAKMEVEVTKVVTALSIFLPDTKRRQHCVVDWMNRPLRVTDLTRIRLAGICRSEKRSLDATIPTAVKQYSTLMDVERRVIVGPAYQGSLLHSVLHQRKTFKSDAQHVAFIHSWLMEIHNKAFIFYHSFCLGEAGGLTHHSVEKHREQYNATICCLMNRLGVRDHDVTIVEYLAEKVKLSQLEPLIWTGVDKGSVVHPLTISSRGNHSFRC